MPSNLVAVTLPWIELVAGLLLIAGVWKRESALVIALMLVVFIVAAGSVHGPRHRRRELRLRLRWRRPRRPSAWPPAWTKGVGWFLVSRNLVLLAASLVLVLVAARPRPTATARAPSAGERSGGQGGATQRPSET